MAATIFITGSTGNIGNHLVRMFSQNGVQVRAAVRSKAKVASQNLPNVEWVEADFERPSSFEPALKGISKVFVLSPFLPTLAEMSNELVGRAKNAGVKHIVRLSATGANPKGKLLLAQWQGKAEEYIRESGLAWTILRPTFFMENILNNFSGSIKNQGKYYVAHGNGKAPYIAARDIAAVAYEVLTGKGHEGKTYELSGPQSLSDYDIAGILTKVAGRNVEYVDVQEDAARRSMLDTGLPQWMVDTLTELNNILKQGWTANVATTLKDLTGKDATTFEQWASEHKNAWS
jgi:uncharacterized protein YbjT (DUF2867 family)